MPFHPFTPAHFITLAIGFALTALLIIYAKRSDKNQRTATAILAFINLSSFPFALYAWRGHPQSLDNVL
jgi:uncharacterized membrane protein YwaF